MHYAKSFDDDEVPDPYYGNAEGFTKVLDLCESGVTAIVQKLNLPS